MEKEKTRLTATDAVVLSALRDVCEFKESEGHFPYTATMDELLVSLKPEIKESLRNLYRAGLVTHNLTVNKESMFGIKKSS